MSFNRNHNSTSERGQFQGHNIGNDSEKTQNISNFMNYKKNIFSMQIPDNNTESILNRIITTLKLMSEERLIY
jgi:hypothetical protein